MPNALIVFDFDGVIADSLDYCLSRAIAACKRFTHERLPTKADWAALDDVTWEGIGRQVGIPEAELAGLKLAAYQRFAENAKEIPVFPGMTAAIRELSRLHAVAVITTNAAAVVASVIARENIAEHIDLIAGANLPGAKSDKIISTMTEMGIDAGRTVMIGDTVSDIREARRAGVRSIAVTWGWQPKLFLERAHPDFFVDSPAELVETVFYSVKGKIPLNPPLKKEDF